MYTQFYGLREKPFSLSPDPRYLFLADSHREALAHLLYGIEQGEGFIAITGEVGTGKTTLCRTLLQRIEPGTEVAFIFNPQLSPLELLQAICAELGLAATSESRRELTEQLNRFLLAKKAEGRRVLLIIDEAQNLAPETLEQIRLLSNLETDTAKLVQIILIGQPELDAILESHELRQLRQRISVRWRLKPLSTNETRDYVRHRLRIAAGAPRELFSELALREVHRRSRGVPRVVNLLCDRALLAGYAAGARSIGLGIVTQTDREIRGETSVARLRSSVDEGRGSSLRRAAPLAALFAVAILGGLAWQVLRGPGSHDAPAPELAPALAPVAAAPAPPAADEEEAAEAAESARRVAEAVRPAEPAPAAEAPVIPPQTPPVAAAPFEASGIADVAPPAAAPTPAAVQPTTPTPMAAASPPAPDPALATTRVAAAAPAARRAQAAAARSRTQREDLATSLARTVPAATTAAAFDALMTRWNARPARAELLSLPEALDGLPERGLRAIPLRDASLATLRYFDRPAFVVLRGRDEIGRVVLLERLGDEKVWVAGLAPGTSVSISREEFEASFTGEAHVVWRDFESLPSLLGSGQRGAPVAWLQHSLGSLGYYDRAPTGEYDRATIEAVRAFQASRRLQTDGTVGPVTKIALYEALGRYVSPRLRVPEERG